MNKFKRKKHIDKVNRLNEIRYLESKNIDVLENLSFIDEAIHEGVINTQSTKDKLKKSWSSFISIAKREGKETVIAAKILKRLLMGDKPTPEEIKYLKGQSLDLVKIVAVMSMGAVSMAIPIALEKILNKWDISIMPKEQ